MQALIVAGGTPAATDPLFAETQGRPKGLMDVAGRPMVQWVLDAVARSPRIETVIVVGLSSSAGLQCHKPLHYLAEQGSLTSNAKAGLEFAATLGPSSDHLLMATADIPLITPEMVTLRADQILQAGADLDYCIIERKIMEARFPGSRRTYLRLKDIEACGGDIHGVRLRLKSDDALWKKLLDARKNALMQAYLLGLDTALMVLLRLGTLAQAERKVSQRVGLKVRAQLCPYAEVGMDVDKPFQLELVRRAIVSAGR
jgi:CTP:molybdopterin cytidylyltransferase MocA